MKSYHMTLSNFATIAHVMLQDDPYRDGLFTATDGYRRTLCYQIMGLLELEAIPPRFAEYFDFTFNAETAEDLALQSKIYVMFIVDKIAQEYINHFGEPTN